MLRQLRILFCLILIIVVPLKIFSQPTISFENIQSLQNAQVLYFSNFDIFDVGFPQYLFDVRINNITQQWDNTKVKLKLEYNLQTVAFAESDEFTLTMPPPPKDYWKASNIELIKTHTFPGSGMIIEFNTTSFDPPDNQFENEVYGSGRARRGKYKLFVELYINNSLVSSPSPVELLISNPSNIQLSSPGNRIGSNAPEEILTEFPVFAFFSDGTKFIVNVYEKLAHHQSVEDVINSGNEIFKSDPVNISVLDYAIAGNFGQPQPLQIGHTYYWFVDVLVPTTAGIEKFRSEVFQFKIVQSTGAQAEGAAVASVIELLRPIVGRQVDEISKTLSDYELKNIRLNGKPITIYELYQIIDGYEGHLVEISDFYIQ